MPAAMPGFPGFPADFFRFFEELAANNNRPWFNESKGRYHESVVNPISEFIVSMAPRLKAISPHYIADPRPHRGSMFRIYRDTRFSADKSPYKTHAGVQFRHAAGKDAHAPGFYLQLAPEGLFFGGGIWRPPNPQLNRIRRAHPALHRLRNLHFHPVDQPELMCFSKRTAGSSIPPSPLPDNLPRAHVQQMLYHICVKDAAMPLALPSSGHFQP